MWRARVFLLETKKIQRDRVRPGDRWHVPPRKWLRENFLPIATRGNRVRVLKQQQLIPGRGVSNARPVRSVRPGRARGDGDPVGDGMVGGWVDDRIPREVVVGAGSEGIEPREGPPSPGSQAGAADPGRGQRSSARAPSCAPVRPGREVAWLWGWR